jgi:hypothetical protein
LTLSEFVTLDYIRGKADWMIRTVDLLLQLRQRLAMLFNTWDKFNSPQGDIQYFAEVPGQVSNQALTGIKQSFQELMDLDARLHRINQSCEADLKIVSLDGLASQASTFNVDSVRSNFK